jgi:hypothetical protein
MKFFRKFTSVTLLSWAALLCTHSAQAAGCEFAGYFHLTSTGPWPKTGRILAGHACGSGFRAGGSMIFKRLLLVKKPDRGSITLIEHGHYRYQAPQTPGTDSFTLRVCGNEGGYDGCADLVYTIAVR